jgi:dolichol-phosphate mannosyltransferase
MAVELGGPGFYCRGVPGPVAVIVPVFNEEDNVLPMAREVAAALGPAGVAYELVFVDDASTDATWRRIEEAGRADPRVRGLRHARNAGQSAALWTGIQGTTAPVLATLDGDLQNDPADLPRLLKELESCDFVCGARLQRRDNWLRRVSSRVARASRRLALKADFLDTGCALRVFKRGALAGVFPFNGLHRFLPILAQRGGARTREVPVNHRPRVAGVSKYGLWNRLGRGVYDLVGVGWYLRRMLRPMPLAPTEDASRREPSK